MVLMISNILKKYKKYIILIKNKKGGDLSKNNSKIFLKFIYLFLIFYKIFVNIIFFLKIIMACRINMGGGTKKSNNKPKQTLSKQAVNNDTERGNPTSVAIGGGASLGTNAGTFDQGQFTVAVGAFTGQNQQNQDAVAVGASAGREQQNQSAVAVGAFAGGNQQGQEAVAVGAGAGRNQQNQFAVAVGAGAGREQ
tara:strand:+ start:202 stop:786 length:585 start_codon:yes stop_codon:yes gene_type:complete